MDADCHRYAYVFADEYAAAYDNADADLYLYLHGDPF